jgi:hypothetical protein
MTITIAKGATTVVARLQVDGYEFARATGTVLHDVIGSAAPAVSWGPLRTPQGTLSLLFDADQADEALDVVALHASPGIVTYTDTEVPEASMSYVARDTVGYRKDSDTGRWVVTIPYRRLS